MRAVLKTLLVSCLYGTIAASNSGAVMLPEYIELNGRLYEVKVAHRPLLVAGVKRKSLVDHAEQTISISEAVNVDERVDVLHKAIGAALGYPDLAFRLVPLIGVTSSA